MFSLPENANQDIRSLYEYWLKISPPGKLPGRQHFDPLDVPHLLPNIWLMEVFREPLRFFYRLAGSRIEEHAGERLTGVWFAQRLEGESFRRAQANLELVADSGEPNWRRGKPLVRWERDHVVLERIYLPLAEDGQHVNMILAMTTFSRPGKEKAPRNNAMTYRVLPADTGETEKQALPAMVAVKPSQSDNAVLR